MRFFKVATGLNSASATLSFIRRRIRTFNHVSRRLINLVGPLSASFLCWKAQSSPHVACTAESSSDFRKKQS